MKRLKVLVLTDHSGHSDQNSIYAILREMLSSERCQYIDVVSRGVEKNHLFFNEQDDSQIYASRIDSDFHFSQEGACFYKDLKKVDLNDYDFLFMRLPRPVSDEWLTWLERTSKDLLIINQPSGIIKTSNKKYLLNFPALCPDMKFCQSKEDVLQIRNKYPIVLKPLREYGGKGIVKIDGDLVESGETTASIDDYLKSIEDDLKSDGYLAMKYLKNVSNGDKRILVVGGEIMACSLRLPPDGSWLCNVAQGGKSIKTEVTPEEVAIINAIAPDLRAEGILIFGADTLEDDDGNRILSEVNTLSIGGFPQAQAQSGKPIIKMTIEKIFKYADEHE